LQWARTTLGFISPIASIPGSFAIVVFVIATMAAPLPAIAQAIFGAGVLSSREVVGGTGGLAVGEDRTQISSPLVGNQRNMDPANQPCLNVHAISERQTINAMIYNHILLLDNHCSKEIKIRACYYKTDSCQEIAIGANKRQRYVFGVFTASDFRFAFREYVN
jgi:hypothetical protein